MSAIRFLSLALSVSAVLVVPAGARVLQDPEGPEEKTITLELRDTDIRDALRMVAKQGGINLVMSNKVTGSITLELDGTSLQEALDAIVGVGGFHHTRKGNVLTVSTLAELLEQRKQREEFERREVPPVQQQVLVLKLRYVDAERVQPVVEKLLGEGGAVTLLMTADHTADDNYPPRARVGSGDSSDLQIGGRLSTSSQGEPAKSHTLVVVDEPARLNMIREVVEGIDVKPVQVLIEARFVEISLDNEHKLGVDWNVAAGFNGATAPHTFPFGDHSLGSFDPNVTGGSPGGVFPPAPNSVSSPLTPGLFTFGTLDFSTFSGILEMIRTDSRAQVVSNPRITVNDRHTATILVGERYPIFSANISEFGTVTEQLDHYEPVGVQLEVTPSVLNDDEIELFVRPSTSSLGAVVEGSTGLMAARITSRQIDTAVTVRDAQTVVLGGLITTREVKETRRVPLLGSIPLLGRLFRHDRSNVERIDLVVFLTVSIVEEHGLTGAQREMFEKTTFAEGGGLKPTSIGTPLEYSPPVPQY